MNEVLRARSKLVIPNVTENWKTIALKPSLNKENTILEAASFQSNTL